jgi:hypothetical protein
VSHEQAIATGLIEQESFDAGVEALPPTRQT